MIIADILSWWYGAAWKTQWQQMHQRARTALQMFSVRLLLGSLFAPFRQIDAGGVRGPLDVQFRAWFDRTFSRFVGFWVRLVMIAAGVISAATLFVAGMIWSVIWLCLPLLPLLGVLLALAGWKI